MVEKYKDWEILDVIPEGWSIDKTAGSPYPNTVFITNRKSVLNGQKRSLLKVKPNNTKINLTKKDITIEIKQQELSKESKSNMFPAKTLNELARKKFEEILLKEILFDLMVCEVENWDKKEYILELKKLINSIDISKKKQFRNLELAMKEKSQLTLF